MTAVEEIKARVDIVDLVSESVQLRHTGKNYIGFCPFHPNSRSPAFVVFPDSGTWRCFGQCNEGGDIFKYVMKKEGCDFPQALQILAARAGVELTPVTPEKVAEEEQFERLRTLLEDAVIFFRYHLKQTAAGAPALEYLQRRGLLPATIETFGLGYAPDSWDTALRYFTGKGYTPAELLQVGLVTERQGGEGVYDRFRHRIIFPIRDAAGRMVGFGARILNPEDQPKFINSPQTDLFDKGRLLYALDQARKPIRAQDQVVIVEGYLDVIALHQGGFTNVVSPMGTALTEDQLKMLKRMTRRIVLALDPDAAGQKATLRGLEVARKTMDHDDDITFDARGLLRHEARLQADLRVTTLPDGQDPDEIVLSDPEAWRKIVEAAKPIVIHVMETLASGQNLDDPKVKSQVAAQVLPLIEDVPNPVEREDYRQRLARMLRVDERSLLGTQQVVRPARRKRDAATQGQIADAQQQQTSAPMFKMAREELLEQHCLHLLILQPEALYLLNRNLQTAGLAGLALQEFERSDFQELAGVIFAAFEQDEMEINAYIDEHISEQVRDLAVEMRKPFLKQEVTKENTVTELFRACLQMRKLRTQKQIDQLFFLQSDLSDEQRLTEEDIKEVYNVVNQHLLALKTIDKALLQPIQID